MRSLAVVGLLLLAAAPRSAGAQIFPGEAAPSSAFPNAFALSLTATTSGDLRATRVFTDSANGCVPCIRYHSLTGGLGLAIRLQFAMGRRTGLRFGASLSGPKPKRRTPNGSQVVIDPNRLSLARGEIVMMFRLKPHVPIYFGIGPSFARFTPGPVPGQPEITEIGGVGVVGIDHQISPKLGTRVEFAFYGTKPKNTGLTSEYTLPALAIDGQLSIGAVLFLQPVVRPR